MLGLNNESLLFKQIKYLSLWFVLSGFFLFVVREKIGVAVYIVCFSPILSNEERKKRKKE